MTRTNLLLAAMLTGSLLLTGCGSDGSDADDMPGPTATSGPTPSATTASTGPAPTEADGQLLDYATADDDGIVLSAASDVSRLEGAPADFTAFIAAELDKEAAGEDEACTEKPQIYVSRIDTGGWASGGYRIPQCGGYASLWAITDGAWKEVWSGQQLTDCATLERYDFPADVAGGTCLDGEREVPYTAGGVDTE